ncbi:MAG TPA: tetratricopeptide repeat protein [Spirochaetota bacterium]
MNIVLIIYLKLRDSGWKSCPGLLMSIVLCCVLSLAYNVYAQEKAIELNRTGVENGTVGRYSDAMKDFTRAIGMYDVEAAKTIHNLGWLYELKDEPENALLFYDEALRRNPDQIDTLERAGYLRYSLKQYDQAIVLGERALKLDPLNKEVIKWLPDAYAQMFKLKEKTIEKVTEEKNTEKIAEKVEKAKEEEKKVRRYFTASYEGTIRYSYLRAGGSGYHYTTTDAYGLHFPQMLSVTATPVESWEVRANTGVPYFGALAGSPSWWTERVEGYFYKKVYFLGMGVMGNHYGGSDEFGEKVNLSDYKLGIVFGTFGERSRLDVSFYPRMLPADTGTATGKTYDVDAVDVAYYYALPEGYKIHGKVSINDFYYFNNPAGTSNYTGIYLFSMGLSFNDYLSSKFVFRADIIERMYLKNNNNKRPYAFMNGQGWFGLDAYHWFRGDPMSGIKTCTTGFSLYAEERPAPHFYLFQRITAEFVGKNQRGDDFCFTLGVGVYF